MLLEFIDYQPLGLLLIHGHLEFNSIKLHIGYICTPLVHLFSDNINLNNKLNNFEKKTTIATLNKVHSRYLRRGKVEGGGEIDTSLITH